MNSKTFITTPIYYVNAKPHIGHLYTTAIADTLTRFYRQNASCAFFLTGTDEHGQKVQEAAKHSNRSLQNHVDYHAQVFKDLFASYGMIYDRFIRTTDSDHQAAVTHFWKTLDKNGFIYKGSYAGWYAAQDESFYTEKEIINGKAPTGASVEFVEEESYYFRLSALQKPLETFFEQKPDFVQPKERYNEALSFIKGGLADISISRSSVKWGIPVPNDPTHTIYVWIDALCNYITALGYPDINSASFQSYWSESIHIVGKDILRFHAIYWPAFLMAAKLSPPKRIVAHGWWINKGAKMSKSLNNVIDPCSLLETYGSDSVRYFLLRESPFSSDGDFSEDLLKTRINADLANNLGNLVLRTVSLFLKHQQNLLSSSFDEEFLQPFYTLKHSLCPLMEEYKISLFCENLWSHISKCNAYIDQKKPWELAKYQNFSELTLVLFSVLEALRCIALLIAPLIPITSEKILNALSIPQAERSWLCIDPRSSLSDRNKITSPGPLFSKHDIINTPLP